MVQLFNLTVPDDRRRSDIDAHLSIDGRVLPFELKSTTSKSVSTVRDFGPDHIRKWRDGLHWLFAFYDRGGTKLQYCVYASPDDMERCIAEKARHIAPDLQLADSLPGTVSTDMVVKILGDKETYSSEDAKWLMKSQWSAAMYKQQQDLKGGYSLQRMAEILQARARTHGPFASRSCHRSGSNRLLCRGGSRGGSCCDRGVRGPRPRRVPYPRDELLPCRLDSRAD